MTQERDLLRAIAREPDDDSVRLVYADWLEDDGRSQRAEFIRGQVRLAEIMRAVAPPPSAELSGILAGCPITWRSPDDSAERRELAWRYRRLLDKHEEEWLAPMRGVIRHEWVWSRGFVEAVDANAVALEASAQELFDLHPVRRLILTGLGGKVDALALIPIDNRLTALDLILNDIELDALKDLTHFRHLSRLKEISLVFNRLRDSSIELLCEDAFFQSLSLLRLGCNQFTQEGRDRLRNHFGDRVSFQRERHPDRLFAFRGEVGPAVSGLAEGNPWEVLVGWGHDFTQLFLEEDKFGVSLVVFDHAGDVLRAESCAGAGRTAWLEELGYDPATIRVKRFPGVFDFPKGWADQLDRRDGEPEPEDDLARAFISGWLAGDGFRYGSYCGGNWLNRKTGDLFIES